MTDETDPDGDSPKEPSDGVAELRAGRALRWLWLSPLVPILAVLAFAFADHFTAGSTLLSVAAAGVMTAAAALAVGIFLGFLFALPRTLDRDNPSALLATNSNLDQVSDWITKILVGIGLVELGSISQGVGDIADDVATALGAAPAAEPFAVALLIYSAVDGFLLGYLWTRTVLSIHLKAAAENLARATEITDAITTTPPPKQPPAVLPPPPPSP